MLKLVEIQKELKAPKNNYNSFGKFSYRSCEDILEAVKPLCAKHGCVLTLSDDIEVKGQRYYVKAIAEITDCESGEKVSVTSFAREADGKKGMDEAQVSGTASSYARKYALNGLFCIDDNKDPDTDENTRQRQEASKGQAPKKIQKLKPDPEQAKKISAFQVDEVVEICDKHHKKVTGVCKYFEIDTVEEMTVAQYRELKKIFKED